MKTSSYALAVLVGFALVNTVFLGAYLFSSSTPALAASATTSTLSFTVSSTTTFTATSTETFASSTTTQNSASNSAASSSQTSQPVTTTTTTVRQSVSSTSPSFAASGASAAGVGGFTLLSVAAFLEKHSLAIAPTSWVAVGGMWIWRGRMRSRWTDLGFDSDVFGLFVKMKGGKTRLRLLDALSLPKDRLQLAQELGLDWKGVDRHLVLMKKYGFVVDKVAYGKVRMYELTPMGTSLLKLLQELSREEGRQGVPGQRLYDN